MTLVAATKRLRREYQILQRDPPPNILARPNPANILEWHYGPKDTPYAGGQYHGKVKFPTEYPHKPPAIYMITPNGRFKTDTRLCLSMSDFHPETWNPMWSVSSILTGLLSFMLEDKTTQGSIATSVSDRQKLALYSKTWNLKNPAFRQIFPELVPEDSTIDTTAQSTPTAAPALTPQEKPKEKSDFGVILVILGLVMILAVINQFI